MAHTYEHILVAVDGSKEAEWAFKKSIAIALRNEATLHLVNVIDTRSFAAVDAYDHSTAEQARAYADELLITYKKEARERGVKRVKNLVTVGSPKTVIARDVAPRIDADLIVCGATGLNAIERFLIGSVSEHIIRLSHCDVLVVRTEEHARANACSPLPIKKGSRDY